jgi:hypothetical protein
MAKLPVPDMTKLDARELKTLNDLLAKAGTSTAILSGKNPLSDPNYRKKCLELRSEFEKTAHEHGATLEHVIAAKGKVYENPKTGEVFMKGKKPKWLEGHEEEYLVK